MQYTSEVYIKLYHYTTYEGLHGILQTQSLWATNYKFLNDYSEIVLFRDKLITYVLPYVKKAYEGLIIDSPDVNGRLDELGGLDHVIKHDTEVFVDSQYRATGDEIYIVSFCGEHENPLVNSNGLLSQWRGYGSGGGFALVFDTKKLEDMLEVKSQKYEYSFGHFADLIYSDDEDKLKFELSDDLAIIAEDVKTFFSKDILDEDKGDILKAYSAFVHCISRYKHFGFCEENEVRIVALPAIIDDGLKKLAAADGATLKIEKERKFRKQNGQYIPYIEMDLPIEKIIVGPHKDQKRRATALRILLSKTDIEIYCSEIPYVG
jgi:hypothetical protein